MFESLNVFIDQISDRKLRQPRLELYIRDVYQNNIRLMNRNRQFVDDPIPSKGIDMISSLINRADIPYLLQYTNDVDRFTRINHEYKRATYSDFIRQYVVTSKAFIYNESMESVEYVTITEDFEDTKSIPFGSNNWSEWEGIRPVTMIANSSTEMLLDNVVSRLKYRRMPPIETIFSINITKLLMQFTKYRLMYPERFIANTNNYPFIYKTCILPLLEDNIKCWLLTIIQLVLQNKLINPKASIDRDILILGEKSNFAKNNLYPAILEIERLVESCALRNTRPDILMRSLMIDNDVSIYDEIQRHMNNLHIGRFSGNQYYWVTFAKEYQLLSIMIMIYSLYPEDSKSIDLFKRYRVQSKRVRNTRFWQHVKYPYLVDDLQSKFEMLESITS